MIYQIELNHKIQDANNGLFPPSKEREILVYESTKGGDLHWVPVRDALWNLYICLITWWIFLNFSSNDFHMFSGLHLGNC